MQLVAVFSMLSAVSYERSKMATPDLRAVSRATAKREKVEREWKEAITNAVLEDHSLREVAAVAGVTHVRVYQIVNEMRAEAAAS